MGVLDDVFEEAKLLDPDGERKVLVPVTITTNQGAGGVGAGTATLSYVPAQQLGNVTGWARLCGPLRVFLSVDRFRTPERVDAPAVEPEHWNPLPRQQSLTLEIIQGLLAMDPRYSAALVSESQSYLGGWYSLQDAGGVAVGVGSGIASATSYTFSFGTPQLG